MKLSEIKGGGGEYLDVGIHSVFLYSYEMKETKNGKAYANVLFKDNEGNAHFEKFFVSERAMWRVRDLALSCGTDKNYDIDIVPDVSVNLTFLEGKALRIEIKKESYTDSKGEKGYNNSVKAFSPAIVQDDEEFQTSGDPF